MEKCSDETSPEHFPEPQTIARNPLWYSPKTGIYVSKHPKISLPEDPFTDVVSFMFSKSHNGDVALVDSTSGHSVPYSDLYRRVVSVASGLRDVGVAQGDVVLLLLPNSIYFPIVLLGVLSVGAIVSPMNPLSSFAEVKKQALDCGACFAFTTPSKSRFFGSLGLKTITVPEQFDSVSDFDKLFSRNPSLVPKARINQEDTAAILYSSGTTGTCKGVVLTHRNFISVIELFVRFEATQYEYLASKNVYLAVLPMFHIYGLSVFVMGLLTLGGTTIVMRKFDGDEMARVIDRYKVTHFHAVPPLVMALTEKAKSVGSERFKSLKQVSCGAAPSSRKSIDEFVRALPHVDFIQGYGMTESPLGARGLNTKALRNYTSVGLLPPNTEAKVVDVVTGSFVPPGRSGELLLRGPGIMKGYLNDPKATAEAIDREGWLRTGDIVNFDEEGYLYICDRLKEMIKYKGFQIAPAELESLLVSHPDVVDAAVTAAKDEEAGEVPMAFVVKRKGSQLSETALSDYVAKQVAPYKKVRKVVFIESIPKSAAGKILRRQLKSLVSARL